jgi:hypothetical protein
VHIGRKILKILHTRLVPVSHVYLLREKERKKERAGGKSIERERLRTELNGEKAAEIMIESLIEAEMTMGMDKGRP